MYVVSGEKFWDKLKINWRHRWCKWFHRNFTIRTGPEGTVKYCNVCKMMYWWEKQPYE